MTERIEAQIERFAPGFRDRILARHTMTASQMAAYNPNYVGGGINGGLANLRQLFTRPLVTPNSANSYAAPAKGLHLCSSSTPPGGGVHGLCGYFAAQAARRDVFGQRAPATTAPEPDLNAALIQPGVTKVAISEPWATTAGEERAP